MSELTLMRRARTACRDLLHARLRGAAVESELAWLVQTSPASVQRVVMTRLCPPPGAFVGQGRRTVRRHGLEWSLDISDYFQWHHFFGFQDEVLDALLCLAPGNGAYVDVGANVGVYAGVVARRHPGMRVIAVEANPTTAAVLRDHMFTRNALPNVELVEMGVSDHASRAILGDHGGGEPAKFSLRPGAAVGHEVILERLDKILSDRGVECVGLLKVDIEGFEPEAVLGSAEFVARDRPLICFEWTIPWMTDRWHKAEAFVRLLDAHGYRVGALVGAGVSGVRLLPIGLDSLRSPAAVLPGRNLVAVAPAARRALGRVVWDGSLR